MKLFSATLVAGALSLASAAQAEKFDLTTMKCKQFTQINKEQVSLITAWLLAYYIDEEEPQIVDLDGIKDASEKILSFCAKNPSFGISAAAEGILQK